MAERPVTVLVADDDELDTRLTRRALQLSCPQAEVIACEDGRICLQELNRMAGSGELPRLLIMDFKMPMMGCPEILSEFNRPDLLSQSHVVLFSSSVGPSDVERCREAGVSEYVEKPTDPDEYNQAIAAICERAFGNTSRIQMR